MILEYNQQKIHYQLFGTGTNWVLALHGYGENSASFRHLGKELAADYCMICPDLPYHGQTDWQLAEFHPGQLLEIIEQLRNIHNIDRLIIAGYSMGGRIAMAIAQQSPAWLSAIWLWAPDGFKINPWYWLATQTTLGNNLFRHTMKHPGWILRLGSTGLFNPSMHRMAIQFLSDAAQRESLYKRWMLFRKFRVNTRIFQSAIRHHQWPVWIFFGEFDGIIPPDSAASLEKQQLPKLKILLLKTGHRLLDKDNAANIAQLIQQLNSGMEPIS